MTRKEKVMLLSMFRMLYMDSENRTGRVDLATGKIICDEIVLVEDGVETSYTYPLCIVGEPDAKSPQQWLNSIALEHQLQGRNPKVALKLRKCS